jgi:iron complex transport system ATP-binding protein
VRSVGNPRDIVTEELIERTFGLPCRIIEDPESGKPMVIPRLPAGRSPVPEPLAGGVTVEPA